MRAILTIMIDCVITRGTKSITGSGSNDYENSIITFETQVTGVKEGNLVYTDNLKDEKYSVTGEYGGETIDLSH
mgnify:CR=1 FL=1